MIPVQLKSREVKQQVAAGLAIQATILAIFLTTSGVVFADLPPSDIQALQVVHDLLTPIDSDNPATTDDINRLANIMTAQCRAVLIDNVITELVSPHMRDLSRHILQLAQADLASAVNSEAKAKILRKYTSRRAAEHIVSEWFGLPSFITPGELSIDLDAPYTPTISSGGTPPQLLPQLDIERSAGPVDLVDGLLVSEEGGVGSGNRVFDAGEWVKTRFVLQNTGDTHLFSTSAWVASDSKCIWIDHTIEHELMEMVAKEGLANFSVWMYLSRQCNGKQSKKIRVSLKDTHDPRVDPQLINVTLKVRDRLDATLQKVLLDADIPGASDGSNATTLVPGSNFELSANLSTNQTWAEAAHMLFEVADDTRALFNSLRYRHMDMLTNGAGKFQASDDLDITTVEEHQFRQTLKQLGVSRRWHDDNGGVLWFAVDTVVSTPSINSDKAGRKKSKRKSSPHIRNKNSARSYDNGVGSTLSHSPSTPGDSTMVKQTPKPVDGKKVARIVGQFVRLKPKRAKPSRLDSLDATDGYEVVFDQDGFLEAYTELSTTITHIDPEEESDSPVLYRFRHYISLNIPPVGRTVPTRHKRRYTPKSSMMDAEPFEPQPKKTDLPRFRLELGFGGAVFALYNPPYAVNFWDDELKTAFLFNTRFTWGKRFTGVVNFSASGWSETHVSATEVTTTLGLGYIVNSGRRFEWHPWMTFGWQYRQIKDQSNLFKDFYNGIVLQLGSTMRLFILDHFGLFSDLGVSFAPDNPKRGDIGLIEGNVFRFVFGTTFRF